MTKDKNKIAIYKYTKLTKEYIENFLKYGVYIAPIKVLNDPYEYKDKESHYCVCSLTTSNNAKLMWSHYAEGHKGISVQVDYPKDNPDVIREVKYESEIDTNPKSTLESLYIKDKKWSYEKEYRYVIDTRNIDTNLVEKVITDEGEKYFLKVKIKAINFGCSAHLSNDYLLALKLIKEYNDKVEKKDKIKVKKLIMKKDHYRFMLDKEYDYEQEIKRLEKE